MYIKTLTIQGFKSYRDQTQIEPFSPKHNVVVGRNGSGKSNFFAAIRFVLSDAYTSMSREERQALLHEGVSTTTTLSAFVEIIFDNTSNRFPTGRDTVTIRRTIGLKKDEYSLDKKSVSKADVMNLLESAGFSRANPYYIVPQGRITSLTNAKDHERLALLKEVAGTHVYETRRAESLGIMAATSAKRAKVGELLEYIKGRLEELEEEKEELGEWMEGDKERRCLEYALYVRELEDVGAALEEVEEERRGEVHAGNLRREGWERREMDMKNLEKEISETKSTLTTLTLTRQGHTSELSDLHRTRTQLTCIITDLQASPSNNPSLLADLESDLAAIDEAIEDKEGELGEVKPLWEDVRRREVEERRELVGVEGRLGELFDKQGRVAQFRTKAERDAFLTSTISSLTSFQNTTKSSLTALQSTLANTRQALVDVEERIKGKEDEGGDARVRGREVGEGIKAMRERLGEVEERRREGWREDTRLESLVGREKEELRGVERELGGMMDKDTGMGLKAIDRIKERYGLDGVYGPLYRLFEIPDPKFNIAVELTAGNSLFHVVVDTDETASKVLDIMMKEKTGRVTFMPLNRLKPKNPPLPNASDAIPLLSKLQYDPSLTKAFQQVFGKTCVCRDLTIAAAYVKSHGINTITLDGDKVDRKGALTGGFHDVRRSRIEAIKNVAVWKKKFEEDERRLKEVKEVVLGCDQEIAKITGEIAVATNRMNAAKEAREAAVREVGVLEKERERLRERIGRLEGEVEEMEGELRGVEGRLDGLRRELSSPMTSGLTQEEEGEIETLQKEVEGRQKRLVEIGKEKAELGTRKSLIEIELGENLKKRRDELRDKIQSFGDADTGDASSVGDLEARTRELKNLNSSIDSLTKRTIWTRRWRN
ncbi:hypothetical protein JAAARDRAFT_450484 [Jaapia argillacea MUCL 33604]|uniref:SMC hinge domain-containing protein n=1 Tax=Jaapia argillacea MUCL 33604 TaxID=933084 RepID=A0A067Q7J0_9AGAM|nr:hypothetical protein JAAARDRAFT_450484 [Jaapia argillacea MUCL 33604]